LPLGFDEAPVEVRGVFRLLGRHRLGRAHRAALLGDLQRAAGHQSDARGGGGKLCGCQFERHGLTSKMRFIGAGRRTANLLRRECALVLVVAKALRGQRR